MIKSTPYLAVETGHALSLLPARPDVLAADIVENIESASDNFKNIIAQLKSESGFTGCKD